MSVTVTPPENVLDVPTRQRSQAAIIRVSLSTMTIFAFVFSSNSTLFLQEQGATAAQVGLLGGVMGIGPLAQLLGLRLIQRIGKVRTLAIGRISLAGAITLLATLALVGVTGPLAIALTMAVFTLTSIGLHLGETAWWPLLQDVTAGEPKGPFFSRMRSRLRVMEVLLPIAGGIYLGKDPTTRMFALPFMVAALGALAGSVLVRAVSERPVVKREVPLLRGLLDSWKVVSVRRYAVFMFLYGLVIMAVVARFWVVMLKELGLPSGHIVWLTAVTAVGHVAGLRMWAWMVDNHGGRSTLSITLAAPALMGLAWLAIPLLGGSLAWLMAWAVAFHLLWGFFAGGALMGRTQVMMEAVPEHCQADAFTLVNLVTAAGGAMGSLLHGHVFEALTGLDFVGIDARLAYLAVVQVASLSLWPSKVRLIGHELQTPARRLIGTSLRWSISRAQCAVWSFWCR